MGLFDTFYLKDATGAVIFEGQTKSLESACNTILLIDGKLIMEGIDDQDPPPKNLESSLKNFTGRIKVFGFGTLDRPAHLLKMAASKWRDVDFDFLNGELLWCSDADIQDGRLLRKSAITALQKAIDIITFYKNVIGINSRNAKHLDSLEALRDSLIAESQNE